MNKARKPFAFALAGLLTACCLSGCSLFVMTGKMLFGDPLVPSAFRAKTGVDLVKDDKKLLLVCSTPESSKSEMPSIDFDLTDGIVRRMKQNGLDVVKPDRVAKWLGDNGGFDDPAELAEDFNADYVAHINLEQFDFREENSPTMFRGRASGSVSVYKIETIAGRKQARQVFLEDYQAQFPELYPVSKDQISARVFQQRFLDRVSDQLTRYISDYRPGQDI